MSDNNKYIFGMLATMIYVVGEMDIDGNIKNPFMLQPVMNDNDPEHAKGTLMLLPLFQYDMGSLKRSSLIAETTDVPEGILKTYMHIISGVTMPTSSEIADINQSKKKK